MRSRSPSSSPTILLLLSLSLAAGCATTGSTGLAVPAFISSPDACALVLGGGGAVFEDPGVNQSWQKINGVVTDAVHQELASLGYRVEKVMVDATDSSERGRVVGEELGRRRCNRIVQINHFLKGQPGAQRFGFEATVLGMPASDAAKTSTGTKVTLALEFTKTYGYDLTAQVMQSLSMGEVGRTIARDVDRSGVVANRGTSLR